MRKLILAGLTALSFVAAPSASFARDHHDGYRGGGGGYGGYSGRYYDRGYRHNDHGDAVAAGVIGLVLGAAIGSAISNDNRRYDDRRYDDRRYDDRYYGPQDNRYYGPDQGYNSGAQCFRRELVWDPRSRQNIEVTHPYPC